MLRERGREVEQDEGEIVQRLDEDDAVEPLHERDPEPERIVEQQIDRAVAAEHELHRDGADERRHHQRHDAERLDQRRAAESKRVSRVASGTAIRLASTTVITAT